MADKLLILLIGGRLQPVTLFALDYQPQVVAIVASQDSKRTVETAIERLSRLLPQARILTPRYVHAYRPAQTAAAIESILDDIAHADLTPAISLTSAPAPMTIGAYRAAKVRGCPAYYLVTSANEILDFAGENEISPLRLSITVEQYMANAGLAISPKQKASSPMPGVPSDRLTLCRYFARNAETSADVLDWLRSGSHLSGQRLVAGTITKRWPVFFGPNHWTMLETLNQYGLIAGLRRSASEKSVSFELTSDGAAGFLKGDWLEFYLFEMAKLAKIDGQAAFDSLQRSLRFEAGDAKREVDFIGTWRGIALIASCKTGTDAWSKKYLDEVSSVGKLLGEGYCTQLLVTNRPRPQKGSHLFGKYETVVKQAEGQKVVIVFGEELADLPTILTREILTPTYPRQ